MEIKTGPDHSFMTVRLLRMRSFNVQNIHHTGACDYSTSLVAPHLHVDPLSLYKYMRCCFQGNNSLENWPPEIWMEWEGKRAEVCRLLSGQET